MRVSVFTGRSQSVNIETSDDLSLWIVGDNLRKGAATNAVQIAELLAERDLIGRS